VLFFAPHASRKKCHSCFLVHKSIHSCLQFVKNCPNQSLEAHCLPGIIIIIIIINIISSTLAARMD
jgi:hypothetical protein